VPGGPVSLVDRRFGPILDLRRQRLGGSEPAWWLCTASLARHPVGALFNEVPPASAGTALDADEATARAVGEALERYSGLNSSPPFEQATLRQGGMTGRWPVCAGDEPCLPSFRAPPADTLLTHVAGQSVLDGTPVLVPAGFVCLGFRPVPPEPPVALPISTGLAFHPERHLAIWNGLCEVVERDAVMSSWWIHRPPAEIDPASAPRAVRERVSLLSERGMTARLYDVTTELGIPTAFCVLTADRYPHLVVGAATRASAAAASAKALDEVVSMRVALQGQEVGSGWDGVGAPRPLEGKPVSLVDHARWYGTGDRDGAFDFLLRSGQASVPFGRFAERSIAEPTGMESLAALVEGLQRHEVSVLWVDLTAPEVARYGTVARVVVPELLPLSPDDDCRWLGTTRLLLRAGITTASRRAFTPFPHPFA
jgi:ribosomal protein S12 methylthiotransferase accessory factor